MQWSIGIIRAQGKRTQDICYPRIMKATDGFLPDAQGVPGWPGTPW